MRCHFPKFFFVAICVAFLSAPPVRAEVQTTVSLTAPAATPGGEGAFSVSQASGPAASASGTALDTYAGVRRFTVGSGGTGRYAAVADGTQRYGVLFDSFQLFQNFLTANQFTIVNSNTSCPSAGTYTWIKVRYRTTDATRNPMSASGASERLGGVVAYDPNATYDFVGASYFNLSGPTLTTATYNIDRLSSGCSSGSFVTAGVSDSTWDPYGTVMFGTENFAFLSEAGSPVALIGAPQVTLTSGNFSDLYGNTFAGLMTGFESRTTQTRKNVYLVPDSAGTTFTIREATSLTDPFTYSALGTLTCTSLNSPANGFCSGTLTISGEGGSGNAVCQLSTPGSRTMLACAAQRPSDNTQFVSFVTTTSPTSLAAATPDTVATSVTPNPGVPPEITVTVSNLTGRKIATMGQPADSLERPQAPFAYKGGSYPGTDGDCGTELAGYSTCTISLTYNPTTLGGNLQTFRQEYDNGGGTVQATGNVRGVTGLTSLAVTPATASYTVGGTQQFTATATYSDLSTQDVTALVGWASNNTAAATISQAGLASFIAAGTAEVSASVAGVNSNTVSFSVSPGPITVETSSSSHATGDNPGRRVFYDSVNDRHWAFYQNGTDIEYSYSSDDGATWTSGGTIATSTYQFDVAFKAIGGTAYVFVVNEHSSSDIQLRRGTCGASMISFDSAITYLDGTTALPYVAPAVGVSASNYVWVAAFRSYAGERTDPYRVFAVASTNVGSGDLSSIGTVTGVGPYLANYKGIALTPETSTNMYLIANEGPATRAYRYASSAWSEVYSPGTSTAGKYSAWKQTSISLDAIRSVYYVSSTEIYVAGSFEFLGGNTQANGIAMWNGTNWVGLGGGGKSDDSEYGNIVIVAGDNVYYGGAFTDMGGNADADRVARWDKNLSQWFALGVGIGNSEVIGLYHDGTNLFVGGGFTGGGGNTNCSRICRWNGSAWASLSTGLGATVNEIASDGTNIFVGGAFVNAGGNASADRIAVWNGSAWSALGTGAPNNTVEAVYYGGSNLYIGGSFTNAGGNAQCDYICRWNGSAWAALSTGLYSSVQAISVSGTNVYAVGSASMGTLNYAAKFDGSSWASMGTGGYKSVNDNTFDVKVAGGNVYVAGNFTRAGDDFNIYGLARFDESAQTWHPVGSRSVFNSAPLAVHTTSSGKVYMTGGFSNADGNTNNTGMVEWTPSGFSPVGSGTYDTVGGMTSDSGGNLFVVGMFLNYGGNSQIDHVFRWNGSTLNPVGTTLTGSAGVTTMDSAYYTGSNLYVGGQFTSFGGVAGADGIARWNGSSWSALSPLDGPATGIVGTDSALYVAGLFADAGGNANADGIALWNGSGWSALGTGTTGEVFQLAQDAGNVYAAGQFTDMGGVSGASHVARWDGSAWNAMGTFGSIDEVRSVVVHPINGKIYIGGTFQNAGGNAAADNFAVWNGSNWEADGPGFSGEVRSIAIDASGRIFVTGFFKGYGDGTPSSHFAYKENVAALAASNAAAEVSATTDASGNLLLMSMNASGYAAFDRFDTSTGWANSVALSSAASSNPCISTDNSSGDRYGFWRETNTIKYKRYTSSAWGSAVTSTSTGTNTHLGCDPYYSAAGKTMLLWTNDAGGGSYEVKALAQP